jgi:hypothetical protein
VTDEVLKQIYEDQRRELDFRRGREQQIFTWSATVLLAATAGTLASSWQNSALSKLGATGVVITGAAIAAFTVYSIVWQHHQRKYLLQNQRVLAKVAVKRGWFEERTVDGSDTIMPAAWRHWGTGAPGGPGSGKVLITAGLGIAAIAALCFVSRL